MAEKMPSSVSVGVRPSRATMRSYSSSFRLCSRTTSGVIARSPAIGNAWVSGAVVSGTRIPPALQCGQYVAKNPTEESGAIRGSHDSGQLVGVEPDAAAMTTGLDGYPVIVPAGQVVAVLGAFHDLSLIHISEPTRLLSISYAVFCLKK